MQNDWQEIKDECPNLYRKGVYIQCLTGWKDIISNLSKVIEHEIKKLRAREDYYVTEIKEKYGTLRFYMNCSTDEMQGSIEAAELMSSQTCEICGQPGIFRQGYWAEVRCDKCYKE